MTDLIGIRPLSIDLVTIAISAPLAWPVSRMQTRRLSNPT